MAGPVTYSLSVEGWAGIAVSDGQVFWAFPASFLLCCCPSLLEYVPCRCTCLLRAWSHAQGKWLEYILTLLVIKVCLPLLDWEMLSYISGGEGPSFIESIPRFLTIPLFLFKCIYQLIFQWQFVCQFQAQTTWVCSPPKH